MSEYGNRIDRCWQAMSYRGDWRYDWRNATHEVHEWREGVHKVELHILFGCGVALVWRRRIDEGWELESRYCNVDATVALAMAAADV